MSNSIKKFNKKQHDDKMVKDIAILLIGILVIFSMSCIVFGG